MAQINDSKDAVQLAREWMRSGEWLKSMLRLRDSVMEEARNPNPTATSSDKASTE